MKYRRSPAIFLVFFFVFLFIGLYFLSQGISLGQNSVKTEGIIEMMVPHVVHYGLIYNTVYYSQIAYFDQAGKQFEIQAQIGGKPGDRVEVAYDPSNPEIAQVNTVNQLYVSPLLSIGLSLVFLGSFVYIKIQQKRMV